MDHEQPSQPIPTTGDTPERLIEDERFARYLADVKRAATSDLARGAELLRSRIGFAPQVLSPMSVDDAPSAQATPLAPSQSIRPIKSSRNQSPFGRHVVPFGQHSLSPWATPVIAAIAFAALIFVGRSITRRLTATTPAVHYATRPGQLMSATLPDGTRITLAPDSRLHYTTEAHGARTVTLTGQAYFTVVHDTRRPFTVHTGTVQTQVLGTAFDLRYYPRDPAVQIIVTDGKVASRGRSGRGNPVLLVAGTEGQLTDSTALVVTNRNADETQAWTHGRLQFYDTPVPEMLQTLQHWFGYEFRLTDSTLAQRHVTARFTIGDTVNTMAEVKALLGVTLHFNGSVITLSPVRSSKQPRPPVDRRSPMLQPKSEVGK